jgi:hypothetical protein
VERCRRFFHQREVLEPRGLHGQLAPLLSKEAGTVSTIACRSKRADSPADPEAIRWFQAACARAMGGKGWDGKGRVDKSLATAYP